MLIIIVIVAVLLLLGIVLVATGTKNKNIDTFKKDSENIITVSQNIFGNLEKENSEYIVPSNEGLSSAMCITLDGLKENDYLENEYKDWEGYLVIEKDLNNKMHYIAWLTNGKYVIDGYSLDMIDKLNLKDETLLEGNSIDIPTTSFKGTDSDKGGLSKITTYNQKCINEKIE
jgi:hypothetical protein